MCIRDSFFTAYQNFDGTWNTSIPTDPGIVNAQTITVIGGSCSASDSLRAVGSLRPAGAGTTCPPLPPDTPSPANGASNVGVVALLSWSGGTPAPSYQLYLGTSNPPPLVATVNGTSYGVGLDPSSTYFWYVVPNLSGAAASMTWSFMTTSSGIAPPSPPTSLFPGNGSTNVGLNPTLTWAPPNGATSYQVAFGLTNPPFAAATITIPSYSPGALGGNATYYWKVTAVNGAGSSSSSIYSFTTMTSPVSGPILVSGLSNPVSITEDTNCLLYTSSFRAAFRINTREAVSRDKLHEFLNSRKADLRLSTDLVRRLSPDSLSIMEFKNEMDVSIAEKMLRFPFLGEQMPGNWNVHLTNELHMTCLLYTSRCV